MQWIKFEGNEKPDIEKHLREPDCKSVDVVLIGKHFNAGSPVGYDVIMQCGIYHKEFGWTCWGGRILLKNIIYYLILPHHPWDPYDEHMMLLCNKMEEAEKPEAPKNEMD